LGPWGMNHKPGVLIWNVYFISQNWLLFHTLRRERWTKHGERKWVDGLVAAVVLLPLLEPLDRFDHWPSWAVYTAHPAVVRVYVDEQHRDGLTESVHAHVGPHNPFSRWRPVSIERWSLDALDVPIYPQDRFQLGVAIALTEADGSGDGIRVVLDGRANRWTGKRSRRELVGRKELLREAERFWLNALPPQQCAQD